MSNAEPDFTPEYLNELYTNKKKSLDQELVSSVKDQLKLAALSGKTHYRLSFKTSSAFENVLTYFINLGFKIQSYGNAYSDRYDEDGDVVYTYDFYW